MYSHPCLLSAVVRPDRTPGNRRKRPIVRKDAADTPQATEHSSGSGDFALEKPVNDGAVHQDDGCSSVNTEDPSPPGNSFDHSNLDQQSSRNINSQQLFKRVSSIPGASCRDSDYELSISSASDSQSDISPSNSAASNDLQRYPLDAPSQEEVIVFPL